MKTVSLAGISTPASALVLGTMTFGDTVDERGAAELLDVALEAGITSIDTANAYTGGQAEIMLATLLRGRDDVVLATKAGMPHSDLGDDAPLSSAGLRRSLEGSLTRLGRESVDLFYLHQPDRRTSLDETMTTIAELVAEGKISAVGVSNYAAWQISELNFAADRAGAPRPVVAQQLYNLVARRIEEEYSEFAVESSLHTMVYNPLGGGLLTGKHRFDEEPTSGRFQGSRLADMYKQRYWDAQLFEAIAQLQSIATDAGMPLTELSFRWLQSKPVVSSILLGGSKTEQLRSNIAALTQDPLDEALVAACDAVGASLRGPMPNYNR
jgi:aryl-alcohol dehydrogenase-like predicted oxidoreductase